MENKMSNLYTGNHFSFFGEKTVYCVEMITYVGNRAGDFIIRYYNINSNLNYSWKTGDYDSRVTIYDN
jgi:hypothetical protein